MEERVGTSATTTITALQPAPESKQSTWKRRKKRTTIVRNLFCFFNFLHLLWMNLRLFPFGWSCVVCCEYLFSLFILGFSVSAIENSDAVDTNRIKHKQCTEHKVEKHFLLSRFSSLSFLYAPLYYVKGTQLTITK